MNQKLYWKDHKLFLHFLECYLLSHFKIPSMTNKNCFYVTLTRL